MKKSNFMFIIAFIFVAILIFLGVFIFYNLKETKNESVEITNENKNQNLEPFTYRKANNPEIRDCQYSYQCENTGNPWTTSPTTAVQQICQNKKCVDKIILIECSDDEDCRELKGDGYICDLTPNNFGKCI